MKQILVATDFSESAANALAYAAALSKILGREICVIHAIHPTEGINNSTYNAIFIEDYYNNKRRALKEWVSPYGENIETLCDVGFLKNVITKYIEHHEVELLVMGITGATGISGIVGSNASMMVSKVKIPTLIIPLTSSFPDVPVITLATDYQTELSAEDVSALNEIVLAFKLKKMQVLYVDEKEGSKHIESGEKKLQELISIPSLEFNYIQNSSALNGITEFIEQHDTDMLCLVKHHHNIIYRLFNRSTINQVMNRSVKAILVLHE
ncbi:nucleotide-binding universal stress UspA family protein [Mucilaginibacter gracilis]|uniref:Nucleotide-binding universal stress UspA family protein n=1 Tax=Mucilaginibacter gracilis TaxID=423350 RepID=A0A495J6N2_9SPHI|nr:universal stress protein [Mucilaginibacter gracilis]RKR84262.1 nucleotide-binding universal stress UspA family protein [Mucilaginibacter gracilis]